MRLKSFRVVPTRQISLPRLRWLLPLQAAVVTLLLLGACVSAQAAPEMKKHVHVYLLRGGLNVFSMGLDEIADKLEEQGIPATVTNYLFWSTLADEAAEEYKSGKLRTIILVGHSSGATVLPDMVARLNELGAPVKLAIGLDSVFHTKLSGRVGRYLNFYVANGAGTPVERSKKLHGKLENIDVEKLGVGHLTIDKDEVIQKKVIAAIKAAL
jgi:hypothetical protein